MRYSFLKLRDIINFRRLEDKDNLSEPFKKWYIAYENIYNLFKDYNINTRLELVSQCPEDIYVETEEFINLSRRIQGRDITDSFVLLPFCYKHFNTYRLIYITFLFICIFLFLTVDISILYNIKAYIINMWVYIQFNLLFYKINNLDIFINNLHLYFKPLSIDGCINLLEYSNEIIYSSLFLFLSKVNIFKFVWKKIYKSKSNNNDSIEDYLSKPAGIKTDEYSIEEILTKNLLDNTYSCSLAENLSSWADSFYYFNNSLKNLVLVDNKLNTNMKNIPISFLDIFYKDNNPKSISERLLISESSCLNESSNLDLDNKISFLDFLKNESEESFLYLVNNESEESFGSVSHNSEFFNWFINNRKESIQLWINESLNLTLLFLITRLNIIKIMKKIYNNILKISKILLTFLTPLFLGDSLYVLMGTFVTIQEDVTDGEINKEREAEYKRYKVRKEKEKLRLRQIRRQIRIRDYLPELPTEDNNEIDPLACVKTSQYLEEHRLTIARNFDNLMTARTSKGINWDLYYKDHSRWFDGESINDSSAQQNIEDLYGIRDYSEDIPKPKFDWWKIVTSKISKFFSKINPSKLFYQDDPDPDPTKSKWFN
jgi:hypothetical protein